MMSGHIQILLGVSILYFIKLSQEMLRFLMLQSYQLQQFIQPELNDVLDSGFSKNAEIFAFMFQGKTE